jgi:energy-coupling factor transporter ATP-binding protein EcfA2
MNMPRFVRIFLSSPGDVSEERKIASGIIERLPNRPSFREKVMFRVVAWDKPGGDTAMRGTMTPQEAINEGLPKPSECDLVLVILWSRMGTPLRYEGKEYLSGTYWELMNAIEGGRSELLIYHRTDDVQISLSDVNAAEKQEQYRRVQDFFNSAVFYEAETHEIVRGVNLYKTLDDFREKFETHFEEVIVRLLEKQNADAEPEPVSATQAAETPNNRIIIGKFWDKTRSPFPGLRPFTTDDASIFYGRGRETDELTQRVAQHRFVAVVGASGSGKSSLINAGLIPRLSTGITTDEKSNSQEWRLVIFTPGEIRGDAEIKGNPFGALYDALLKTFPALTPNPLEVWRIRQNFLDAMIQSPSALLTIGAEALKNLPEWSQVVLFIDQFEELFTLSDERYIQPFILMLEAIASSQQVRAVITMRSDFYPRCVGIPELARLLENSSFPLSPPSRSALRQMIEKPAEYAGLSFDEDLVDQILDDTGNQPGMLALLAYALDELYQKVAERNDQRITFDDYRAIKGVQGAIGHRAETAFEKLRTQQIDQALNRFFPNLVEINDDGTASRRRRIPYSQLVNSQVDIAALNGLIEARLLVADYTEGDNPSGSVVELAHDALLTHWVQLVEWLARNRDFQAWHHRLEGYRKRGIGLRGKVLGEAANWLKLRSDDLTEEDRKFIRLGLWRERTERLIVVGVILLIFLLLSYPLIREEVLRLQARGAEAPVHLSELGLSVEPYEVTNGRYRLCVEAGRCSPPVFVFDSTLKNYYDDQQHEDSPVTGVDNIQAADFCSWIGRSLPKLEQFETMLYGTNHERKFPWGVNPPDADRANLLYNDEDFDQVYSNGTPEPVGGRIQGGYQGIFDLVGNVSEWTASLDNSSSYVMGASYLVTPSGLATGMRLETLTSARAPDIGFRCIE